MLDRLITNMIIMRVYKYELFLWYYLFIFWFVSNKHVIFVSKQAY
ncbi:hypothetical protein EMIT0180MI3_80039 [Priestia megaterium]